MKGVLTPTSSNYYWTLKNTLCIVVPYYYHMYNEDFIACCKESGITTFEYLKAQQTLNTVREMGHLFSCIVSECVICEGGILHLFDPLWY
jgi:hypothetical protein